MREKGVKESIILEFRNRRNLFNNFLLKNSIKAYTCQSCGYPTLLEKGNYEICDICDWEDDGQDDENADEVWGGPNKNLSLTDSRFKFGEILREVLNENKLEYKINPEENLKFLEKDLFKKTTEEIILGLFEEREKGDSHH